MSNEKKQGWQPTDAGDLVKSVHERTQRRAAVNWPIWLNLPTLRVWEAVALSLAIEPNEVSQQRHGERWLLESQNFKERLQLAAANLNHSLHVHKGLVVDRADTTISLREFCTWAASIGWTMPRELEALATREAPEHADSTSSLTAETADRLGIKGTANAPAADAGSAYRSQSKQADANAGPEVPISPSLKIGHNAKKSVDAHITQRGRELHAADNTLTKTSIAKIIATEMKERGERGERGKPDGKDDYLSAATIERRLPQGLGGGRKANGRKTTRR